ncbi:MAG: hypothetical protein WBZ11_14805 [Candidatus Sulfotelmatobacter sp.]|jgi:hypothetical protein
MSRFKFCQSPAIRLLILAALFTTVAGSHLAFAQQANGDQTNSDQKPQSKAFDVQSSVGDLHMGNDADARKAGLPLYPGARLHHDDDKEADKDSSTANLSLFTSAFGVKLVIAKYDSEDAPAKVIDFYREKLKKYGKVLECHTHEHGGTHADIDSDNDSDNEKSKALKCEGDNSGPVTELKVGTQNNQHVVAIEPSNKEKNGSTTFALVYVHARGKEGDI